MSVGVRTQRSVVDKLAQRGYDHIQRLEKKRKELSEKPKRNCSLNLILSKTLIKSEKNNKILNEI